MRRGRALARERCVEAGMWLVGCVYNFCGEHDSLQVSAPVGSGHQWQGRTLAMAAGLTDHSWELREVLGSGCRRSAGRRRAASHDGDDA